MRMEPLILLLALSACSARDFGIEPIKLSAGEASKPQYGSQHGGVVKSLLSGSPN